MRDLHVLVLAAGKGTRMKSVLPKVLHPVAGRPLLDWVLHAAAPLEPSSITVIVGYQGDALRRAYQRPGISFVVQEPQLGTAHAVIQAEPVLGTRTGTVLLLYGDVPLIT